MALKPELKSWLEHVGPKLSPEVSKLLATELEKEDVATVWRETVMARSDYSRAHDELAKKEQELIAKADEATKKAEAWYNTNVKWREENEAKVNATLKAKELADAELASHRARIKALAEQGLIDPNDPGLTTVTPPKTEEPKITGLTQEALQAELAKKDREYAIAIATFEDLADEHYSLTGQKLKRTELMTELMKSGGSLQEVWEKKYNIPQIRADLAEKKIQERIEAARQEAIAKYQSERAADVHSFRPRDMESDGENKHILSLFQDQSNNNALQGSEAVRAAKASWERGEFRQQPSKA